jgi:hypothetical protein
VTAERAAPWHDVDWIWDWYDYRGASDEELEFFVDAMERDILKIASARSFRSNHGKYLQ